MGISKNGQVFVKESAKNHRFRVGSSIGSLIFEKCNYKSKLAL
jgi:hypothetical protein